MKSSIFTIHIFGSFAILLTFQESYMRCRRARHPLN